MLIEMPIILLVGHIMHKISSSIFEEKVVNFSAINTSPSYQLVLKKIRIVTQSFAKDLKDKLNT